jgi:hypothetical protein
LYGMRASVFGGRLCRRRWPDDADSFKEVMKRWDRTWGDRLQELVMIGTCAMDRQAITDAVNAGLIKIPRKQDLARGRWKSLPDPFPAWQP